MTSTTRTGPAGERERLRGIRSAAGKERVDKEPPQFERYPAGFLRPILIAGVPGHIRNVVRKDAASGPLDIRIYRYFPVLSGSPEQKIIQKEPGLPAAIAPSRGDPVSRQGDSRYAGMTLSVRIHPLILHQNLFFKDAFRFSPSRTDTALRLGTFSSLPARALDSMAYAVTDFGSLPGAGRAAPPERADLHFAPVRRADAYVTTHALHKEETVVSDPAHLANRGRISVFSDQEIQQISDRVMRVIDSRFIIECERRGYST